MCSMLDRGGGIPAAGTLRCMLSEIKFGKEGELANLILRLTPEGMRGPPMIESRF